MERRETPTLLAFPVLICGHAEKKYRSTACMKRMDGGNGFPERYPWLRHLQGPLYFFGEDNLSGPVPVRQHIDKNFRRDTRGYMRGNLVYFHDCPVFACESPRTRFRGISPTIDFHSVLTGQLFLPKTTFSAVVWCDNFYSCKG
ncbi:hypothetical protein K474DRAFT_570420 [Panus rudis PR-1116 ss-1]|nr:hypothetical protein K474DRAFT_570420 [Panus rudis PR-1116 ss-1]